MRQKPAGLFLVILSPAKGKPAYSRRSGFTPEKEAPDSSGEAEGKVKMVSRVLFRSQSVEWSTPPGIFAELKREFKFNFDPCPIGGNGNGLVTSWRGKRVFCNPPYGPGVDRWLKRGLEANTAVFLLPARTDTRWFHGIVLPFASEIRFLPGRLNFGNGNGKADRAPFPSMVVIFRQKAGHK